MSLAYMAISFPSIFIRRNHSEVRCMCRRMLKAGVKSALVLSLVLLGLGNEGTNAQSSRCPAYPAFPDANCTGTLPGVARTSSGSITTSSNGQIIQNLNISGSIFVQHANVIIRNVRITNPGGVAVANAAGGTGSSFTLEDCELDGTGNT